MFFGGAHPVLTAVGCLVIRFCGFNRFQIAGLRYPPAQFVLLMPYVVTVAVLAISMATKIARNNRKKSSLHYSEQQPLLSSADAE